MRKLNAVQEAIVRNEARRRVERALRLIEDAQGNLNEACAVLSSLRYAIPQWKATGNMADRVRSHWYAVQDALRYNKASKITLDPQATETVLSAHAGIKFPAPARTAPGERS